MRALEDYNRGGGIRGGATGHRRSPQPDHYDNDRNKDDFLTGPVTQAQVRLVKDDL